MDQRVQGSIPVKGTYLGCRLLPGPGPGGPDPGRSLCRKQPIYVFLSHPYFSLSLSLPLPLKINGNISSGENLKRKAMCDIRHNLITAVLVSHSHKAGECAGPIHQEAGILGDILEFCLYRYTLSNILSNIKE
uniref:Uncharacterized protein n=1 Tax=Myotis myotis TaxID=51298 RepID=A0A7J7VI75_MYOMY|nr:hypothetical protein mMyoMyo1_008316 [Myotis myotis]